MGARRVAAIRIPGLPLQCAAQDDPALRQRPVAIIAGGAVIARNLRAVEAGIGVGMHAPEAAVHAPDILLVPDDPRGVQAVWDAVLDYLEDAIGPVVEDAGPGEAFVDVRGVGNERLLVRRALVAIDALLKLSGRAAVADGPAVASIAARRATRAGEITIVPRGSGAAFLAAQPVTLLPLPPTMQADLALVGVHTIGGFAALRPSDVQRRFGRIGTAALDLALGRDDRPLVPRPRERGETLAQSFDPPVEDTGPVLFMLKSLLDSLAGHLRAEGMVAHGLAMTLTFESGEPLTIDQRWGAACIPGPAELDALRLTLDTPLTSETTDAMPPRIAAVCVTLHECVPDAGVQLPLIGGATILRRQAVAHLLTRLRALLGPDGVVEAVPKSAHLLEDGWTAHPYEAARVGTLAPDNPPVPHAALLPVVPGFAVCQPPDAVAIALHGAAPASLLLGAVRWDVIAALGPYAASGGWWEGSGYNRAYWLLLTEDQALHLIAEDRVSGAWARYGVFR